MVELFPEIPVERKQQIMHDASIIKNLIDNSKTMNEALKIAFDWQHCYIGNEQGFAAMALASMTFKKED